MSDTFEELVQKSKFGNKEAFSDLIGYIYNDLYTIAISRFHNEDMAKDAIQETLILAYLGLPKLKYNKYFKTWITKILLNECNKIHNSNRRDKLLLNQYINQCIISTHQDIFKSPNTLDLEAIKEILTDKENKIFYLFYEQGFTVKQISKKLNINENTIKSRLKSARTKIKNKYSSIIATLLIVILLTTGVVFGNDIINYIKQLFNLNNIGIKNEGILNAIEDKEWVQNIDMNYIDITDNYKLKVNYLLVDDINLYIVFELISDNAFNSYNRFTINDLVILDENDNIIYDADSTNTSAFSKSRGWKNIYQEQSKIEELLFAYSDEYPKFKQLKLNFSKITLYNTDFGVMIREDISTSSKNVTIEMEEKFFNRTTITYEVVNKTETQNYNYCVEKAIITDTGFYAVVSMDNLQPNFTITDEYNNKYNYELLLLNWEDNDTFSFLITANITSDIIKIRYKKDEIILSKAIK